MLKCFLLFGGLLAVVLLGVDKFADFFQQEMGLKKDSLESDREEGESAIDRLLKFDRPGKGPAAPQFFAEELGEIALELFELPEMPPVDSESLDEEQLGEVTANSIKADMTTRLFEVRNRITEAINSRACSRKLGEAYLSFSQELMAVNEKNKELAQKVLHQMRNISALRSERILERNRVANEWQQFLKTERPRLQADYRKLMELEKEAQG